MRDYVSDIYENPDRYKPVDVPYVYDIAENVLAFHYFPDPDVSVDMNEVRLLGNAAGVFLPMKKAFPGITSIYFTSENGINLQYDDDAYGKRKAAVEDRVAMRGRIWYALAQNSDGPVISDVYDNITDIGATIAVSAPVFAGGEFKGVVGLDILLDELNREVATISVGGSERAELLTDVGAQPAAIPGMLTRTSKLALKDWTVLYTVPESEVTAPVKNVDDRIARTILQFAVLLVLILALTVIAAGVYAESISVPLTATAVEKERISAELDVSTQIQSSMLPHIFPPFPHRKEIDIFGIMDPAREVGGDFYDFFLIDDKKLAVVIADVSGKSVPAALFMVIAKTLLSNHALMGKSPKDVFETVNNTLCENNDAGLFVTCFMGYLDIETGEFVSVNAGHNPPLLKRGGEYEYYKTKRGLVLAGNENTPYTESRIVLRPNDVLYLYTDGITEADNRLKEFYGEGRLLETINKNKGMRIEELCICIRQDVALFSNGAEQADDITMLAIRFNGKGA
jgi:serine phosphatase RsbU (regulator of sigma subunit)